MAEENKNNVKENINLIVRLAEKDLDGNKPIYHALTKIKGVSHRLGLAIARVFERETGISIFEKIGKLDEKQVELLEKIIKDPLAYGIPNWMLNRRKDYETGKDMHLVASKLDFTHMNDIKRLKEIRCYRGVRHALGLKVRGQRTKSTGRKGLTVGVSKKEAKR